MEKWEYRHEWLETPYNEWSRREDDAYDVQPKHIEQLNAWGTEGWEVCTVLESQGWRLVLLKRKVV
jgi:hypothetical protein